MDVYQPHVGAEQMHLQYQDLRQVKVYFLILCTIFFNLLKVANDQRSCQLQIH
jgi:hypothetical protein